MDDTLDRAELIAGQFVDDSTGDSDERCVGGQGRLVLSKPINKTVTYHDPCRLNKHKNIHEAPRFILNSIPGLTFKDVDHVTQWSYCSGGGGGLPIEKPDITAEISRTRLARARELGVDMLVSACVWSERPLATSGHEVGIEVAFIVELVAESPPHRRPAGVASYLT